MTCRLKDRSFLFNFQAIPAVPQEAISFEIVTICSLGVVVNVDTTIKFFHSPHFYTKRPHIGFEFLGKQCLPHRNNHELRHHTIYRYSGNPVTSIYLLHPITTCFLKTIQELRFAHSYLTFRRFLPCVGHQCKRVEGGNGHTRKAFAYTKHRASGYT